MKTISLFIGSCLILFAASCGEKLKYEQTAEGLHVDVSGGTLALYPLADNALRVRFFEGQELDVPEFVLDSAYELPEYRLSEVPNGLRLSLEKMVVELDGTSGDLRYYDTEGKLFLQEKPGSRVLRSDSLKGAPAFFIEQAFDTSPDEVILGLGQFQDGQFNLNGVSRRLTQVNSQIAIPFIYSSKGYGLLWHQYGLTDYNPADQSSDLVQQDQSDLAEGLVAEVTTTERTQSVAQDQMLYTGRFSVPAAGTYSLFLDLGAMGNRHYVLVDGVPLIDQSNMWLPPTAGVLVELEAGEHEVQVVCKADNSPGLSWKDRKSVV